MARHPDVTVVGAGPDEIGAQRRGRDRIHDAVTANVVVVGERRSVQIRGRSLVGAREIGADDLPRLTAVARTKDVLVSRSRATCGRPARTPAAASRYCARSSADARAPDRRSAPSPLPVSRGSPSGRPVRSSHRRPCRAGADRARGFRSRRRRRADESPAARSSRTCSSSSPWQRRNLAARRTPNTESRCR